MSEGKAAFVSWLRAKYPLLPVNDADPTHFPIVSLVRCDHRRAFRPVERVDLIDAHIVTVRENGTLVWEYRKLRVRPWWRALYRWFRAFIGKPLPGFGGADEVRPVGPHIAAQ